MNTITTGDGKIIDLDTLQIVGREEGSVAEAPPRQSKQEMPSSAMDTVNQLSWGFNSALFALPDAAQRAIGNGLGMKDDEIFQFTRLFNKGEKAPQNTGDRYVRAIGEGVGGTLPFTGILAWAAKSRPLVTVAESGAGILKGIANDAISFVQKNPRLAAATDIAFGAGYEGLRQAVEENVSDDNPNKKLYTELMPMAAFMGLPLAMQLSPARGAAKSVGDKVSGFIPKKADLGAVEQEAIESLPGFYNLPVISIVPRMLMKRVEGKLEKVFGPIADSPESQQALAQLQSHLADPRVADVFLVGGKPTFDVAEQTMFGPLLTEKAKLLEQLGPKELASVKLRISENQQKLNSLFQSFAPEARKPIEEAFMAAQADRQQFFEALVSQRKDLTAAEIAAVSERLGPQDINNLNNELRGALMSNMEMSNTQRRGIMRKMGMTEGMTEEGLPLATRQDGKSLFDSQDMENAAIKLIEKYKPERPSLSVQIPEPIRLLERFVKSQQVAREKLENDMIGQLTKQAIDEQFKLIGYRPGGEDEKAYIDAILSVVRGDKTKAGKRKATLAELAPAANEQGIVRFPTAIPGRKIEINPAQIQADAKRISEANTQVDINVPEALDYLAAAQRFRNDSLNRYNTALQRGRTRLTDAQRYLDTGDSVYNDIENLIKENVPKISKNYDELNTVLSDYRDVYQRNLPLLTSQKTKGGLEFAFPNEALLQKAFQNADSLKQLQLTLQNTPQGESLLMRGTVDWLRTKGVVNKEGLVDPKQIRSVLDKNQNIVNALPANVRAKIQDEVALADAYVARLGELDQRMVTGKNAELDNILSKAARPDADPSQTLFAALKDPATMRTLVNGMSKDPEMLAALRRSVWELAGEGARAGGAFKGFLDTNQKSLKVLFTEQHLKDLNILADLQRRVYAFADVTGQIPLFESIDQNLKRVMGFGVQFLTTTAREAMVGRINPASGALALMLRMTASAENQLYSRMFTKALEDPAFAQAITHVGTPAQGVKAAAQLEGIGANLSQIFNEPLKTTVPGISQRIVRQELPQEQLQGRQADVGDMKNFPVVPRETSAQQMLKALPPAPATRGLGQEAGYRFPIAPPGPPASGMGQVQLMYPSMFPNDPISGLLQQRQAMIQGGQQPVPGQ
jgi:hypothetical protein